MKRKILIIIILFLFSAAQVYAGSIYGGYFIDDFSKNYPYNFTGGKEQDVFDGDAYKQAPWCVSKIVRDRKRGRALRVTYDVEEGRAAHIFELKLRDLLPQYNALSFWVKGTTDSFLLECVGAELHDFVVSDITEKWQHVVVPFTALSKSKLFSARNIAEIRFVVAHDRVSHKQGKLYIDDLKMVRQKSRGEFQEKYDRPGRVAINDDVPVFTLATKYRHNVNRSEFLGIRFEASRDKKYWFYLGEDRTKDDHRFTFSWDTQHFIRGTYFIRALALYEHEGYGIGRAARCTVRTSFDFLEFIDQTQRKSFRYFVNERDADTFLVKESSAPQALYNTKACGLALSAYCVGAERGFIARADAVQAVASILTAFSEKVPSYYGFYPRNINPTFSVHPDYDAGDIIATAYLVAGALTAASYFDNADDRIEKEIKKKAFRLYKKIRWRRALVNFNGRMLLTERIKQDGTTEGRIEGYRDGIIAYILAIAAPIGRISPSSWDDWAQTYTVGSYGPYELVQFPSLYGHQFDQIWLTLQEKPDGYLNYFSNTITATLINREFCMKENNYPAEIWGLTRCVGPHGYRTYGAPPPMRTNYTDGTICPSASGSALAFIPELALAALHALYSHYGDKVWGKYGIIEAYNPNMDYFEEFYTGINVGNLVLQIENYRSGLVGNLFMKHTTIRRTLRRIGFDYY